MAKNVIRVQIFINKNRIKLFNKEVSEKKICRAYFNSSEDMVDS